MTKPDALTERELSLIRGVFANHSEISRVILFGSRAKGTHKPYSDVDLAICGDITHLQAQGIAAELDELPLPYRYDVQPYELIRSKELRDHIDRVGIQVY
jgi:predicted nucleotidyltransferase